MKGRFLILFEKWVMIENKLWNSVSSWVCLFHMQVLLKDKCFTTWLVNKILISIRVDRISVSEITTYARGDICGSIKYSKSKVYKSIQFTLNTVKIHIFYSYVWGSLNYIFCELFVWLYNNLLSSWMFLKNLKSKSKQYKTETYTYFYLF